MKNVLKLSLILVCTQLTIVGGATAATHSSFNEVMSVVNDIGYVPKSQIEQNEFQTYQQGVNPVYPVSMASVFANGSAQLERDAQRTIERDEDYYDRIAKLLHPNGVCVAGKWQVTETSPYTGLFAKGSEALIIGRISVAMGDVLKDEKRGFGFAGKLFATNDGDQKVPTANFFSVDVLLGTNAKRMLDVKTTNEPETGFSFSLIGLGLKIAAALKTADENPSFRPLYPVAQAGLEQGQVSKAPKWFRLSAHKDTFKNKEADFRNEILRAVADNKSLRFNIDVSDVGNDRNKDKIWTKLGEISIDQATVSYGCDRRLHFAHPKLVQQ